MSLNIQLFTLWRKSINRQNKLIPNSAIPVDWLNWNGYGSYKTFTLSVLTTLSWELETSQEQIW